jgi:hypothetical protein
MFSFVGRDDVSAKAVSLVGDSFKEDNNENAAPNKINYTGENLPSSYQAPRPIREHTDSRSLSRSDLLHLIEGNEGLDESQKEGLFRVLENYTVCPGSVRTVFIKNTRRELFSKFHSFYSK